MARKQAQQTETDPIPRLIADLLLAAEAPAKPQRPPAFDPAALPGAARHRFPPAPKPLRARTRPVPAHSAGGWWSI